MSRTVTCTPRFASASAIETPMIPAPMTMTFMEGLGLEGLRLGARAESLQAQAYRLKPRAQSLQLSSGAQIIPVHERVEPQEIVAVRLVAPERARSKKDDVSLAER